MHPLDLAWRRATTDVGVIAWTANPRSLRVTRVTAPGGVLFGFPRGEWIQPGFWLSRIVPAHRDMVSVFLTAVAAGESVPVCEYQITDSMSRLRHVRTSASLSARRRRRLIAGVHQDVTDWRTAEQERRAADRRFELATQLGGVSVCQFDQATGRLESDPVLWRMLGLDPSISPTSDEWIARIHPDDRPTVLAHAQRILAGGPTSLDPGVSVPRIEFRMRGAAGDWLWLAKAEVLLTEDGCPPRLAAVVMDITAEVEEREARLRAEQLYREIWNSIPASAVALNAAGEIVDANPAWHEAVRNGSAPRAIVGQSYIDVTDDAARKGDAVAARALEGVRGVLTRQSRRFTLEYECPFPDRGDRWFRMNAFALQRPGRGAIVIHWDITDRKISELAIQQARDHLADMQRLSTMSELATSIAHELNQPLATIMAAASTARRQLREGRADRGELKPIVDDIVEATARAAEVMRRARAMIRRDTHLREDLTLNEIVSAVSRLLASDLVIHQVTMTMNLASDLPPIFGDRIQLQQVLLNLLLNAVEAVEEQPRERRRIMVTTALGVPGRVELVVADTGRGIPSGLRSQLFDPFTTTKHDGTGLGLAIVRAIVESHGGRVAVESPADGGAAFRVSLPYEVAEVTPDVGHRTAGTYSPMAARGRR